METMTLEYVRDLLASYGYTFMDAMYAIDAAIRERDELTAAVKLGKLCADVGAGYMQRARKAEAELAALRDAGHAKVVPSLLCGKTPDGRHYVLTGDKESVNIVSDMLADAERLAEALEMARNGLLWYQDHYPNEINGCDDEAMAAIEAALAAQENPND